MERSILVYQGLISLTALFLIASAEIASYDDNKVYKIKQKSGCPNIHCPWNCERYLDRNGCNYCGECSKTPGCPRVDCSKLLYFGCVPRIGQDGCVTCLCRRSHRPYCPKLSMCSADCIVVIDSDGCEKCECDMPSNCPEGRREEDPCQSGCQRERSASGCYDCVCAGETRVCEEVKCPIGCRHKVDETTGCPYACDCTGI